MRRHSQPSPADRPEWTTARYRPLAARLTAGQVHAGHAGDARRLLSETLVEDEREAVPEIANAMYLDDAKGRRPRDYGLIGAYARIWLWSFGAVGVAFGVFLLLRIG